MPVTTIPLGGVYNTRQGITFASTPKDFRLSGAYIEVISDAISQSAAPYVVKRPGLSSLGEYVSGQTSTGMCISDDGRFCISTAGGNIYFKSSSVGTAVNVGGMVFPSRFITAAYINNETYFLISSNSANPCAYLPTSAATVVTPTFTANTNTSVTLTNVSSFTGLFVGQALSGTDIASGARIAAMDTAASTITMTLAATGTTAGVTVTFTRLALIIDSDFPSSVKGAFAFMDGYCFIMSADGKIYQSDLNNPAAWSEDNYIQGSQAGNLSGTGRGVVKVKSRIVGMYSGSAEFYYNAGNPAGSVLSLIKGASTNIGTYDFAQCGDYVMLIGAPSSEQSINCYLIVGDAIQEITSPPVSRNLSQVCALESSLLSGGRIGGNDFFFFSIGSNASSWMYCIQTKTWCESALAADYMFAGTPLAGGLFAVNQANSILYQVSSTAFQDGGSNFSVTIQTELKVINKGKGFVIKSVELLADNQASGSTSLSISGNDYASFQTIGSFDLTATRKKLFRCGYYTSHAAFKLEDSGNNAWRGQALIVDWEPCNT